MSCDDILHLICDLRKCSVRERVLNMVLFHNIENIKRGKDRLWFSGLFLYACLCLCQSKLLEVTVVLDVGLDWRLNVSRKLWFITGRQADWDRARDGGMEGDEDTDGWEQRVGGRVRERGWMEDWMWKWSWHSDAKKEESGGIIRVTRRRREEQN